MQRENKKHITWLFLFFLYENIILYLKCVLYRIFTPFFLLYLYENQRIMKPNVKIELQPYLHDYLYHDFGCSRQDDGVQISSGNDMGKFIQAMVTISDRPPKQPIKDNPITLYLPIQEWNHFVLQENFIYIPEWKQRMLQEYIEASFRLRIREYFVAGYEKGYKQDKIIRAFLLAYNIKNNALNYDAVKKYDYRNRQRMIKEVNKDIQLSLF